MKQMSTKILLILAGALAAVSAGCDRIWPSSTETASKNSPKPSAPPAPASPGSAAAAPAPAATVATAEPPPRMTLAQQADFDAWMIKTYLGCWKQAPQPTDADLYVAQVRLAFRPDGSLSKPPKLVNPPANPALKPQARSVMQAVQTCDPLPVPAQYRPFYEQWKNKTIHFSPQIAAR